MNILSPGHIDTPIFETRPQGEALTKIKRDLVKTFRSADWEIPMRSPGLNITSMAARPQI
jgi:hypothetical protein